MTRVAVWHTGRVGSAAARMVALSPSMELVGCYTRSPEKIGVDVGALCNVGPIGVTATDRANLLLESRPDCVFYAPARPDLDDMIRIVSSGTNLVTPALVLNGRRQLGDEHGHLDAAATRAGVSVYGGGMHPGLIHAIALTASGGCQWVEQLRVVSSKDCTYSAIPDEWKRQGIGASPDDPALASAAEESTRFRAEAVDVIGTALGIEFDDVRCDFEVAVATSRMDLGFMVIERGTVAGIKTLWRGIVDDAVVVENETCYRLGDAMKPDWPTLNGYMVEIHGHPSIKVAFEHEFAAGFSAGFDPGTITAAPLVNAIPAVCRAQPGIVLLHEMPTVTAHGAAGPRATWAQPRDWQITKPRGAWPSKS